MPMDENFSRLRLLKILAAGEINTAVKVITATTTIALKLAERLEPDSSKMVLL